MPISFKSLKVGARVEGTDINGEFYTGTVLDKKLNRSRKVWEAAIERDDAKGVVFFSDDPKDNRRVWIVTYNKTSGHWGSDSGLGTLEFTKVAKPTESELEKARTQVKESPCGCDEEMAQEISMEVLKISPKEMLEMMEEAAEIAAKKVPEPTETKAKEESGFLSVGCVVIGSMALGVWTAPIWYELLESLRLVILNWLVGGL